MSRGRVMRAKSCAEERRPFRRQEPKRLSHKPGGSPRAGGREIPAARGGGDLRTDCPGSPVQGHATLARLSRRDNAYDMITKHGVTSKLVAHVLQKPSTKALSRWEKYLPGRTFVETSHLYNRSVDRKSTPDTQTRTCGAWDSMRRSPGKEPDTPTRAPAGGTSTTDANAPPSRSRTSRTPGA